MRYKLLGKSGLRVVDLGFPHDFLAGPARQYLFGETFGLIDNHRA